MATASTIAVTKRRSFRFGLAGAAFAIIAGLATAEIWKPIAKRHSRWVVIGTNIYQNTLRRARIRSDQIGASASAFTDADISSALRAVNSTFQGYLRYSGLNENDLRGLRVLELGPGDNIGVAIRFAAAGASFVSTIDKFVPLHDSPHHRKLYAELRDGLTPQGRRNFDTALDVTDDHLALQPDRLQYVYGRGFEDADVFSPTSFDLIVSNAVIEEIYDVDRAFDAMHRLLRPGGYLLHKIDLRDYGMFTKHGYHPLEFLTVPDVVYRHMVESTGQPNRRLVDYYRRKTADLGYETSIYTTWVLANPRELVPHKLTLEQGVDYSDTTLEQIRSIRPRLLDRYKQLSDADLMVEGIYLVARKLSTTY
jgi:SAM-dependent methyltransferase